MIELLSGPPDHEAAPLALAAFRRSVSKTAVRRIASPQSANPTTRILVAIEPDEAQAGTLLDRMAKHPGKLILFGRLPPLLCRHLSLRETVWPGNPARWSRSQAARPHASAQSPATIHYTRQAAPLSASHWRRPLERFDFTDEWNNLGYGAIRADASIWALAIPVLAAPENTLAELIIDGQNISTWAALFERDESAILWFNRPAGPIDSFEWRLVERFLSSWRHDTLPCQPVLQEIPWGYEAAVTMRLDCDEDIDSARALHAAYHDMKVPFSLAVHTASLDDARHHTLLKEMTQAGEAILSHTATHAPNWGGNYDAALNEARVSARRLKAITGQPVRYAVSPFHQSPPYALAALADAGYDGCIGGIIRNDPEFLLARGGSLTGLPDNFIGHSQQCMLHGDCLLHADDPIAVFKSAFAQAKETRTLLGYLDHPFSERYRYGWLDEAARIAAHRDFIAHIRRDAPNTLFLSENDAMDFLRLKSACEVLENNGAFDLRIPDYADGFTPTVEYAGNLGKKIP